MLRSLRRISGLTPADCRGLFIAYYCLLAAGWRIFVLRENLDRWIVDGSRPVSQSSLPAEELRHLRRQGRLVNLAARCPIAWARCLQRSLGLCLFLERKDVKARLRIGVRKDGDSLKGHAWVEYGGSVLNDSQNVSRGFTVLTGSDSGIAGTGPEQESSQS